MQIIVPKFHLRLVRGSAQPISNLLSAVLILHTIGSMEAIAAISIAPRICGGISMVPFSGNQLSFLVQVAPLQLHGIPDLALPHA